MTAAGAGALAADARRAGEWVELRLRNDPAEVQRASAWVERETAALDLPHELRYRLDTVLAESLTNVITHAYGDSGSHEITLRLAVDGTGWALEMEDDGVAFNPLEAPAPRQPGSLAEATVGGLGIHLIRSFTDECRYRRENGRNHLTMVARPRPTASRPT
jgi:anti-sigma regulatory factor (Ser/Thr protein kinase)